MTKRKLTGKKALMYQAMQDQLGIVTAAVKQVGIDRTTHYAWLKKDENYKDWIEEAEMQLRDFGENALLKLMKEGNPAAIIFFNKTKNKDRGYLETKELDIKDERTRIIIDSPYDDNNKGNSLGPEQEASPSNEPTKG